MERRNSRKVRVGNIFIGGDAPITIQSMLNKPSTDIEGSVAQQPSSLLQLLKKPYRFR